MELKNRVIEMLDIAEAKEFGKKFSERSILKRLNNIIDENTDVYFEIEREISDHIHIGGITLNELAEILVAIPDQQKKESKNIMTLHILMFRNYFKIQNLSCFDNLQENLPILEQAARLYLKEEIDSYVVQAIRKVF